MTSSDYRPRHGPFPVGLGSLALTCWILHLRDFYGWSFPKMLRRKEGFKVSCLGSILCLASSTGANYYAPDPKPQTLTPKPLNPKP